MADYCLYRLISTASIMCYKSMDLSQRALETNGKLFSYFELGLVFKIFAVNLFWCDIMRSLHDLNKFPF